ncbi:MAG: transcriptional repressor [Nitrospirota bacterium]
MPKEKFREFLCTKGLKATKGRDEIIDEIMSIKGHFDPEELFVRLKTKGSKVSRASVYRTIPLLIECGFIEEVERIDKHAHYERVSEEAHHDHMICIKCGKVIEFFSPTLEMLQDELCQKEKFKKVRHSLEIFGYCSTCGGDTGKTASHHNIKSH